VNPLSGEALTDKTSEPAFFQALLDATVYAHAPRTGRSGRLHLIQFSLPQSGLMVLPFFSDELQARAAAGSTATVVTLTGRQLFELSRGATLMLNPNSTSCTLYPEEIAALLDHGEIGVVDKIDVTEPSSMEFREPDAAPSWLIDPLIALYARLPSVEMTYMVEFRSPDDTEPEHVGLLIGSGVPSMETERAVRATITTIQPLCRTRDTAVDLTAFVPSAFPDWARSFGTAPLYVRALWSAPGRWLHRVAVTAQSILTGKCQKAIFLGCAPFGVAYDSGPVSQACAGHDIRAPLPASGGKGGARSRAARFPLVENSRPRPVFTIPIWYFQNLGLKLQYVWLVNPLASGS
jgi:hypothetical protein